MSQENTQHSGGMSGGAPPRSGGEGPGPQGTAPTSPAALDEQIASTMKATLEEPDPVKRSALNGQLRALHEQRWPEPAPTLKVSVPLTEAQQPIADAYVADAQEIAKGLQGVDAGQLSNLMDFAVAEAVTQPVDVRNEAQCWNVGRTRYGVAWDGLVDDARRAVGALGDGVRDYLNSTGAGNDPAVVAALASWHRGHFKFSAQQAKERMATEKDPLLRRLLAMLARGV